MNPIEPYGGYRSAPTIDNFSSSYEPLENDAKQLAHRQAWNDRHRESINSWHDQPQLPNQLNVNLNNAHVNQDKQIDSKIVAENNASFFDKITSFFNSVYNYFWGSPDDESPGSPISNTPKLASPWQLKMFQTSIEQLSQALEDYNITQQRVQEIKKEEDAQSTSAEDAQALFFFLALLKKAGQLKNEENVISATSIQLNHEETKRDHEKRKDLQVSLEESENSAWWSGAIGLTTSIIAGVTGLALVIAGLVGGPLALPPALALAGKLASVAFTGISGAAKLAEVKHKRDGEKQKEEISTLKHRRDERSFQAKDHSHDIKLANQSIASATTNASEAISRARKIKQAAAQF